jgi:hypothetical protein
MTMSKVMGFKDGWSRTYLFLGFLIIVTFVSCSSDDKTSTDGFYEELSTRLYMISGKTGNLEPAVNHNEYKMTLYEVPQDVLWITDRPARKSGSDTTRRFVDIVWPASFAQTAPNAVFKFLVENENVGLFLTLREPMYDSERETLTFKATLIRSTFEEGNPRLEETLVFDDPSIVILNNGEGMNYVVHSEIATVEIPDAENMLTITQKGLDDKVLWASSAPSTFSDVTPIRTLAGNWDAMFSVVPPNAFMFGITGNGDMKGYSITLNSMEYSSEDEAIVYLANALGDDSIENGTLNSVTLVIDSQETTIKVQFDNQILAADGGPCSPWTNDTATVFLPGQNPGGIQLAPNSKSAQYEISTGGITGAGIQVNFWYWCQEPDVPVGPANGNKPQNPDNSGGQFIFGADCSFTQQPAVFGKGIETYKIADVTSALVDGVCVVTIQKNRYTGCVTPNCCTPEGSGACQDVMPREYTCSDPPP